MIYDVIIQFIGVVLAAILLIAVISSALIMVLCTYILRKLCELPKIKRTIEKWLS